MIAAAIAVGIDHSEIESGCTMMWFCSRKPLMSRTELMARKMSSPKNAPTLSTDAAKARMVLREWNGYDPDAHEQAELDSELDRRIAEAGAA